MYVACTQEREQIVGWRILFLIKQVMYAAFSPINENVFTTEAWILLGPSVHKLNGWLPLITVLLETCAWSGLTVACLALERTPMCFAWIVGNQQGFRLPGKFNCGKPVEGKGDANAHCGMEAFFMQAREREKRSVWEKVVPSSPHKPPVFSTEPGCRLTLAGTCPYHWMMPFQWTQTVITFILYYSYKSHLQRKTVTLDILVSLWKSGMEVDQWAFPTMPLLSDLWRGPASCLWPQCILPTHSLFALPPSWILTLQLLHVFPSKTTMLHKRPRIYVKYPEEANP